jgi:hypothetical protein
VVVVSLLCSMQQLLGMDWMCMLTMPSLLAGMPLVRMVYRSSFRPSSVSASDGPRSSSMSRFAMLCVWVASVNTGCCNCFDVVAPLGSPT